GGSTLLLLGGSQEPVPTLSSPFWAETGNYTCEFCGKQYKYYTPYQEHVALHAPITESAFSRRIEGKAQNHFEETNSSSQNSSEPYTCGACGIQFQFYNNLLEHMQSHADPSKGIEGPHNLRPLQKAILSQDVAPASQWAAGWWEHSQRGRWTEKDFWKVVA
ncbi:hypothetical protein MC885_016529, partial [Smutsia gigantea]